MYIISEVYLKSKIDYGSSPRRKQYNVFAI